jgi:hypothetical protein
LETVLRWLVKYPFVLSGTPSPHHAMSTLLGSVVFGSLTLRKANWILPSENSSIKSANSPSPVVWTDNTLSFPESAWKALASGALTEKTAQIPWVGEDEAGDELTIFW